MKNKDWIIIALIVIILVLGIGLVWTMHTPGNATANNTTPNLTSSSNPGNIQKTQTSTSTQVTNTPKTNTQTETQSEYITLTCAVCGKQFQSPRDGPQLRICDECVNTPEGQKLLQEAGY